MLIFVIPLRNPETAQDWERCNSLCQQTVRSALAQIDRDIRVVVACKDFTPDIEDERLTILRRPFPAPSTWDDHHHDKYRKISHALVEARKYAPCYVMKLDADDLVSRTVATEVHARRCRPGYYMPRGYLWRDGSMLVRPIDGFHHHCGSSNIIWCEPHELPASPNDDMSAFPIMCFGHNIAISEYQKLGTPLAPIATHSVIYRKDHGDNLSWRISQSSAHHNKANWKSYVGQFLRLTELRPLTSSIRQDFFGQKA